MSKFVWRTITETPYIYGELVILTSLELNELCSFGTNQLTLKPRRFNMKFLTLYKRAYNINDAVCRNVDKLSLREIERLQEQLQMASNNCLDKIDELKAEEFKADEITHGIDEDGNLFEGIGITLTNNKTEEV
jgi:hypothetical protein|tara:strand:+ start:352 stop:750 length:399 start_codon:yes stop_codon:yes gene_type:complete